MLKNCLDILLTPITDIINISMETSTFPQNFKEAHVRPLLRKTSLPKNELKNYRPVSKLSFISKILVKIVANRLQAHIKNNHLSNPLQSAYRKHHSTESALLKVYNDIIISMDKGEVTALTLLDLSAAFDTIDHATLTDRLSDWYGISGQAQIWFSSYLQNTHRSVKIEVTFSDKVTLSYGVPQGSVLGPVLFTLYTTPLSAIISSFDINHHLYADDTQIYMSLSDLNAKESLEKLQHCLMGVSAWMTGSKLKLNPSKTEFLLIGTKLQREKFMNNFPCLLLGQDTNPSTSAKNLGVLFDSSLNVDVCWDGNLQRQYGNEIVCSEVNIRKLDRFRRDSKCIIHLLNSFNADKLIFLQIVSNSQFYVFSEMRVFAQPYAPV